MRSLKRNQQEIFYALYEGTEDILDEDGYETSETEAVYSTPVPLRINMSAASGENSVQQFGAFADYDKILVTCDLSLPIDEQTVFWIDNKDITKPFDYRVKKIAKSLNSLIIAVKKER